MYNFIDLNERADERTLNTLETTFNSINLDKEIKSNNYSFTTLNVTGRSHFDVDIDNIRVNGRDGSYFIGSQLETRTITIEARLKADTKEDYRELTNELNKALFTRDPAKLSFSDDEAWFFYAQFLGTNNPKEDSNDQVVELSFMCLDPFKYKEQETLSVGSAEALNIDTDYPIVFDEVIMTFSNQPEEVRIYNTQSERRIIFKLQQNLAKSNLIILDQNNTFIGYNREQNAFGSVDLMNSDFKALEFNYGEQMVVQPTPTNITLKYRGKRL